MVYSDGRFLYAVVPEKPPKAPESKESVKVDVSNGDDDEEEDIPFIYIRFNAFDPMSNLEHCNSLLLKRPLPSESSGTVLDFNPSSERRRKENAAAAIAGSGRRYDPYGGRYGRYGSSSKYGHNTSSLDLGAPPQLQFDGSLTMECWFRYDSDDLKRVGQQLFYHGDGAHWTYIYVQSNSVYVGCNGPTGSSNGRCSISAAVNVTEWTHIAATYDSTDGQWRIYLNGQWSNPNARTVANPRGAPQKSTASWIVGSVPTRPFFGQIVDVRIWSVLSLFVFVSLCGGLRCGVMVRVQVIFQEFSVNSASDSMMAKHLSFKVFERFSE